MADSPPAAGDSSDQPEPAGLPAPLPRWHRAALPWAAGTVATVAWAWFLYLLVGGEGLRGAWGGWGPWLLHVLIATAFLLLASWQAVQQDVHWSRPLRRLLGRLSDVQDGSLPIESLSDEAGGGPAPLIPVVQDLLRELRRQRAEVARLELEIGQRVANRTGALERALGSMKEQASRDALTGLNNRRMLDEHLPRLIDRRKAEGGSLTLLMIDVDHFKLLNDTLGHAAGDQFLRSIGQIIRSGIRDTDLAFRCGGDEFVVVLDPCEPRAAGRLADRLVTLVDALAKPLHVPKAPRLSIGLSHLSDFDEPTAKGLLEAADRVLYAVKGDRKRQAG